MGMGDQEIKIQVDSSWLICVCLGVLFLRMLPLLFLLSGALDLVKVLVLVRTKRTLEQNVEGFLSFNLHSCAFYLPSLKPSWKWSSPPVW